MKTEPIKADISQKGEKIRHFWNFCVGAGRANEGLRAGWLEHLKLVRDNCGFAYCRFHGLFHDDMFVYSEDTDGNPKYNWQYIDDLFARMLQIGVRPFVELGFCPGDLASDENTTFWWKAHTCPPKDMNKWVGLIENFVRHCIRRYGISEVKRWYFEVWNEPNLGGFWSGTKSQYFELYKRSALAIKKIDGSLKVGGPSTSNFVPDERFTGEREDITKHRTHERDLDEMVWKGVWIKDFLKFAEKEKLPVDFVSTHPYPTDWALDEKGQAKGRVRKQSALLDDCTWLKETIKTSAFPEAEIHLTEWNSSPSSRDYTHDYLQEAVFVFKTNLDVIGLADSLSYWTFTDIFEEQGGGGEHFHGGFGMINYQGIAKPAYHAYRFLNNLGDEMLHYDEKCVITKTNNDKVSAVMFNYPDEMDGMTIDTSPLTRDVAEKDNKTGTAKEISIELTGLEANAEFELETLDAENGSAMDAYKSIGCPAEMTPEETQLVKTKSFATAKETLKADGKGKLMITRTVQPWSMVAIRQL